MSEYQYYEFRAVDRPLTECEMAELRSLSTRATITATSFQNEYHWGDFRGDPLTLMQRYFDAFVYVANWGTRKFMLRLPASLLPVETAYRYAADDRLRVHRSGDNVILDFELQQEEPEWVEGEGWLDSLLPLRDDIARGNLGALYIGWLSNIWMEDIEDGEEEFDLREPPVAPGLQQLSVPLRKLVEFLQVDEDLLTVAAERSQPLELQPESILEQAEWLRRLPGNEKDRLLLEVMQAQGMEVRARLLQRFRHDTAPTQVPGEGDGRTMAELLIRTEEHRKQRIEREKERAAREFERSAREAAIAREKYLSALSRRKEATWMQVESLIQVRRGPEYDQAAQYIVDLYELAQREGALEDFTALLNDLRARHGSKSAFIRRLDAAKLG